MSSPSGARPADVAIETKSIDESSSATLDWRKCVNNSGQLYNFNDSTDMSQRKRSAEMGHVSRKHDKGKRRPSCTEHAGSVRSPAGSSGVQESGGPEREKRTQSLSTPDSLAGRENLASTLVNMALQSKLDLHAPDVLSRAISLLGKEHGESCGGVSLGSASACTSEERSVGCSDSLFSQKVQSGSTHQLPSGVDRKEKDPTPNAESLKSQPSMADKATSCSGQPQNEKLLAHLLTKRPVLNSILDVDDNVQVSEVLRNVLNEESTPYIKEALACLAPSSMLSEADHLYVERQRTNVQLVANRVKMWQVKQKQRSLFAQVAVLKEKIACADFAAALRKRRKENPKTP